MYIHTHTNTHTHTHTQVLCLRLITKNTMEEKMIAIAKRKMALESVVVDNGSTHKAALSQVCVGGWVGWWVGWVGEGGGYMSI